MKKKYKRVFSINNDLGYRNYTVRDLINLKGKRKLTHFQTVFLLCIDFGCLLDDF